MVGLVFLISIPSNSSTTIKNRKILGLIVILMICVSCNQKRKAEVSLSSYTHDVQNKNINY